MTMTEDVYKEKIGNLQSELAEMDPFSSEYRMKRHEMKTLLREWQLEGIDDPLERLRQMQDWSVDDAKEFADSYLNAGDINEAIYWKLSVMEDYMEAMLFELRRMADQDRF